MLRKNEECPADILVIDSKDEFFLINQKKINESSQLLLRKPISLTSGCFSFFLVKIKKIILVEKVSKFKGKAKYLLKKLNGYFFIEKCKKSSQSFKGILKLHYDPKVEILDETNLIMRGAILKFSDWWINFYFFR